MEVKIKLDPKLVWQLSEEAEQIGSTPSRIIGGILTARYALEPVMPQSVALMHTRHAVAHLHAEGFSDEEIAVRVDRVVGHVARVRRELGLKPNRRKVPA